MMMNLFFETEGKSYTGRQRETMLSGLKSWHKKKINSGYIKMSKKQEVMERHDIQRLSAGIFEEEVSLL
jgi:lipopolysaccharide biosynthesis glycosyltransferase